MHSKQMIVLDHEATGKKIKGLCAERNITPKDLADFLCFGSPTSIYRWFEGKSLPSLDNLVLIATRLNVSIDEIIVTKQL